MSTISIPGWLLNSSLTHGCGTSMRVNPDASIDTIKDGVPLELNVATAAIAADQNSASWTCANPNCHIPSITVTKPVPIGF